MNRRVATIELEPQTLDRQEWSVINLVEQVSPTQWLAVTGLCDGLPAGVQRFDTEEEALKAIGVPAAGAWKSEDGKVVKIGDIP